MGATNPQQRYGPAYSIPSARGGDSLQPSGSASEDVVPPNRPGDGSKNHRKPLRSAKMALGLLVPKKCHIGSFRYGCFRKEIASSYFKIMI